jgi:hypothetical protein
MWDGPFYLESLGFIQYSDRRHVIFQVLGPPTPLTTALSSSGKRGGVRGDFQRRIVWVSE